MAIRDWRFGFVLNYSSGRPIQVPAVSSPSVTSNYTFQTLSRTGLRVNRCFCGL